MTDEFQMSAAERKCEMLTVSLELPPFDRTTNRRRERWALRLAQSNGFCCLLANEPPFRIAMMVVLALVVSIVALFLPLRKVPIQYSDANARMSLAEMWSAWNARRLAEKAVADGRDRDAIESYRLALGTDPTRVETIRAFLRCVADNSAVDWHWMWTCLDEEYYLLRLSTPSANDLELISKVYERYDYHDRIIWLLGGTNVPITPALSFALLKANFEVSHFDECVRIWKSREPLVTNYADAQLYHSALEAGWGGEEEMSRGKESLLRALDSSLAPNPFELLAAHLSVRVAYHRLDMSLMERAIWVLSRYNQHGLQDEICYWLVLDASGRRDEAIRMAQANRMSAQTYADAELLATALDRLGLYAEAAKFAAEQLPLFDYDIHLCARLTQVLYRGKEWAELRAMGLGVNRAYRKRSTTRGFADFLQGLAACGTGNRLLCREFFERAANFPPAEKSTVVQVAATLNQLGFQEESAKMVGSITRSERDEFGFWQEAFESAVEKNQLESALFSAERIHRLRPNDTIGAINYASMLLITQQRPAEALNLAAKVLRTFPSSINARINQAIAFIQMGRAAEAEPLLREIESENLLPEDRSAARFARYQYELALGNSAAAIATASRIDRCLLLSTQLQW